MNVNVPPKLSQWSGRWYWHRRTGTKETKPLPSH